MNRNRTGEDAQLRKQAAGWIIQAGRANVLAKHTSLSSESADRSNKQQRPFSGNMQHVVKLSNMPSAVAGMPFMSAYTFFHLSVQVVQNKKPLKLTEAKLVRFGRNNLHHTTIHLLYPILTRSITRRWCTHAVQKVELHVSLDGIPRKDESLV